jgi:hypothetical protein
MKNSQKDNIFKDPMRESQKILLKNAIMIIDTHNQGNMETNVRHLRLFPNRTKISL